MSKLTTIPIAQSIKQITATIGRTAPGSTAAKHAGGATVLTGFDNALPNATNLVLLAEGGTEGVNIKSLFASSTDAFLAHVVQLWVAHPANVVNNTGTGIRYVGSINVPLSAGGIAGTVVNVDLLGNGILIGLAFDSVGKPFFALEDGHNLYAGCTVQCTTLTYVHFNGYYEDFAP